MSARSITRPCSRRPARRRRAAAALAVAGVASLASAGAASGATLRVTSLDDSGPGSLRDAVAEANADAGRDLIEFARGLRGEITLASGEIAIESALEIAGPGSDRLTISGDMDGDGFHDASDSRVFSIRPDIAGSPSDPVALSGLTIAGGHAAHGDGGGLRVEDADLSLTGVVITGNRADGHGGGVFASGSRVTLTDSVIAGNRAAGDGGGLFAAGDGDTPFSTALAIRGSSLADNESNGNGGGVHAGAGIDSILISHSTLASNEAGAGGGGAHLHGADWGRVKVSDSTLHGNLAGTFGGGLHLGDQRDDDVKIGNSTIAGNEAVERGGGVFRIGAGSDDVVRISSTIVAGNSAPAGNDLSEPRGAAGEFAIGHSLIGETSGRSTIVPSPQGTNALNVDARLGPLADNGGPTMTMLPSPASPAVDAGIAGGLARDQRGERRTVNHGGAADGPASDGTDIGAVELADSGVTAVVVKARPEQRQRATRVHVKLRAGAGERVRIEARGDVRAGRSFALTPARRVAGPGGRRTISLRLKRVASARVLAALARSEPATARVDIVLTDAAGNSATDRVRIRLARPGTG